MRLKYTLFFAVMQLLLGDISLAQNINTIIGGTGDNGPATAAGLSGPNCVAIDRYGNIYVGDYDNAVVRKVDTSGIISLYAGITGTRYYIYTGDGGPAVSAIIGSPVGLAVDTFGNLFIADGIDPVVRRVDQAGIITTYAGAGFSGADGIPATNARVTPSALATDRTGNLFIADASNNNVRMVSPGGIISTVAGNGTAGFSRDGFPATSAELYQPAGICVDKTGNLFIADEYNYRIRKVDKFGVITTYAGNGGSGYTGDGLPATTANFNKPVALSVDTSGNVYIVDNTNSLIRKVSTSGIITNVCGIPLTSGFSGDGNAATTAKLNAPAGIAADTKGNLFIADASNNRIRKINPAQIITTIAGCNFPSSGNMGDGGPGISSVLAGPSGLGYDTSQNLYIADGGHNVVRKVNNGGIITAFAGNYVSGFQGDNALATSAELKNPSSVVTDKKGNVFICDAGNKRIRKVNRSGIITTYAGTGTGGYSGDGHRADSAGFSSPSAIALDKYGNLYVSDPGNYRVRKIDTNQIITTIVGNGFPGYFGDGGLATAAQIQPNGIYIDDSNNIFIADAGSYRIRKIDASGIISTFAGNGTNTISVDGATALAAGIGTPNVLSFDKFGNILFTSNYGIRKISPAGIFSSLGGNGSNQFSGDGSQAILAGMGPAGLITDTAGNVLLSGNNRIRKIYNANITVRTAHDTICATSGAIFTAVAIAATEYRPFYHWQKNGRDTGTNSSTLTVPLLDSGDVVACYITDGAAGPVLAASNRITIYILSGLPSLNVTTDVGTNVCIGTTVTCSVTSIKDAGIVPILDWYKNGILMDTGVHYGFTPANGDVVYCVLNSSLPCLLRDTAHSLPVTFTTYIHTPAVSLSIYPTGTICLGSPATVYPSPSYGGTPPVYNWYKNGTYVYTGNSFIDTPSVGEIVNCQLISNATCITTDTAYSGSTALPVAAPANPTVSISAQPGDTICSGTNVNCLAGSSLGGTHPIYDWYKNGILIFGGTTYTLTPLNGDNVRCRLTSNATCLLTDTVSQNITFVYTIPLTDSVSISVSPGDTICYGTNVVFTPAAVNGGSTPIFDWYKNGNKYHTGTSFTYSPADGDIVYCKLTSDACATPIPAVSNSISIPVKQNVTPSVSISADPGTILCSGIGVVCTAKGTDTGLSPIYTWYRNGTNVFIGSQYTFTPGQGDQLYCQLTSTADCASPNIVTSGTTAFEADSLPVVSITCSPGHVNFSGTNITFYATLSNNTSNVQYQWIKNGVPVPGATGFSYSSSNFLIWDSVKCVVTVSGACSGTITSNALAIDTYHGMKLYPNPNDGDFEINGNDYDANGDPAVNIRIYSSNGKLVYEKNDAFDAITFYTEIKLGHQLPAGVYLLRLNYSKQSTSFTFVVRD